MQILHVGLGPLGRQIASDLFTRGLGRVTAAVDIDPEIAGQDLSLLASDHPSGTTISGDLAATLETCGDIDVVLVTTSSDLAACADTFRALLERGYAVVSTCEELLWPSLRHPELAVELEELALANDGRLLGTGVNPGFLMDTLPVVASSVCREVSSVTSRRIQDATDRRVPFQQKIGANLDNETFSARVADGSLRHVGLGESMHFAAHYLGLKVERWTESIEAVIADRQLECDLGTIEPGTACGVRQVAEGFDGDLRTIRLEFQATIGEEDPRDELVIEGEPPLEVVLPGGVHGDLATSAMTLNSIRSLLAAPPGLHTMATIPLVHFAAPTW